MKEELLRLAEPLVWESTTPAYTRFVSHSRYMKFRPYARKWYRPICPNCGPASVKEQNNGN